MLPIRSRRDPYTRMGSPFRRPKKKFCMVFCRLSCSKSLQDNTLAYFGVKVVHAGLNGRRISSGREPLSKNPSSRLSLQNRVKVGFLSVFLKAGIPVSCRVPRFILDDYTHPTLQ